MKRTTVIALGLVWGMAGLARAADLTAYTEEWAPYNYAEGPHIKGISTDILRAACAEARRSCNFQLVPWARAYKIAVATPNTVLYTTARKPSREHEFLWLGPILPRATWVYVKTGREKSLPDFNALAKVKIGIVREEASKQDLLKAGVPQSALVEQASNADVLKMLTNDMVDAMVDTEVSMAWHLKKVGLSGKTLTRLMNLSNEGAYYFAVNRKTDSALVRDLEQALEKLRRNGKINAIIGQYVATAP